MDDQTDGHIILTLRGFEHVTCCHMRCAQLWASQMKIYCQFKAVFPNNNYDIIYIYIYSLFHGHFLYKNILKIITSVNLNPTVHANDYEKSTRKTSEMEIQRDRETYIHIIFTGTHWVPLVPSLGGNHLYSNGYDFSVIFAYFWKVGIIIMF